MHFGQFMLKKLELQVGYMMLCRCSLEGQKSWSLFFGVIYVTFSPQPFVFLPEDMSKSFNDF